MKEETATRPLNEQQRRFAEHYAATNNAYQSAIEAGYSETTARAQGKRLLEHVGIRAYLATLTTPAVEARAQRIATATERQAFWTSVMYGETTGDDGKPPRMSDRLKASELLGKSQADFVDRHELTGKDGNAIEMKGGQLDDAQRAALIASILERGRTETP